MAAKSFLLLLGLCLWAPIISSSVGNYDRTAALHPDFTLAWSIRGDAIHLAMQAKAKGWVAFGIAEMGSMRGADIVQYELATNKLTDAYALGNAKPYVDSCQDWELESAKSVGGVMTVLVKRKLISADPQDRSFLGDAIPPFLPTPVIVAWGDSPSMQYHGADKRVQTRLRFFDASGLTPAGSEIEGVKEDSAYTGVLIASPDFEIPTTKTTYHRTCFNLSDYVGGGGGGALHAVAFEPYVHEGNENHVHHFVVHARHERCGGRLNSDEDMNMIWVWAPGTGATVLPAEAGFRILGDGFQALVLEIHYDNPTNKAGMIDHSGFVMYTTPVLRQHDAGILILGDPTVALWWGKRGLDQQVVPTVKGTGWAEVAFDSGKCTDFFQDAEVTVWARFLHMHKLGQKMVVTQNRGGKTVRTDSVEYYDFDQAGGFNPPTVGAGFSIQRGDSFKTQCFYYSPGGPAAPAKFGLGSNDEMCMDFIFYYPAQPVPNSGMCAIHQPTNGTLILHEVLEGPEVLGRTFGGECASGAPPTVCVSVFAAIMSLAASLLLP